MGRNKLYV